jgi:hypothetical protein
MRRVGCLLVSAALVAGISFGCASAASAGRVYLQIGPPVPIVEVRGVSPGVGFVWIAGYHRWAADRYAWVPGYWARPPHPRAYWVPPQWRQSRHGWYFVAGRWR